MPKEVKAPTITETYTVMLDQPVVVEASSLDEAVKLAKRKQTNSADTAVDELTAENTDGKR